MALHMIVLVIVNVVRRSRTSGQAMIEYAILFAVIAVLTVIGVTTFDDSVKTALQGFFNAAANKIAK